MFDFFGGVDDYHNKRKAEFEKLATDPPAQSAEVGSRVLVSAGVIGRGFEWERIEGTVIEVADTAYHVRLKDKYNADRTNDMWVHRFAVTDVLVKAE